MQCISTTISQKHLELLKKHAEKLGTQQKALEYALECMESSSKQNSALTEEEKLCMHIIQAKLPCLIERECLKKLIETADIDLYKSFVTQYKPIENVMEHHFQKPLKECSIKEIIDGLVINSKISNWFDTVNSKDDIDHYTIVLTHRLGLKASKIMGILIENVFITYGAKVRIITSENSTFIRILKK
jgi:hypothetical protein